jgi:hypothetical protein
LSLEKIKDFVLDGSYMKLKQEEEKLYVLKKMIREEQDSLNLKRIVWNELGVVGVFETYKIYNYNHLDLNILLQDLGVLPLISFIKSEDLTVEELEKIKHVQTRREKYIKFSPNKVWKQNYPTLLFDSNIDETKLIEKVDLWRDSYYKYDWLNNIWKREKLRALFSPELNLSKKITFEGGTITLLEARLKYRTEKVFKLLDPESILKRATVDLDRIVEFTARGFLGNKELNNIRKVVDVQRRYLLMTIQKEQEKKDYWYSRLIRLSKLSQ